MHWSLASDGDMKTNKDATVICPLCGGKVNIIEYDDLVREHGIDNWRDIHGFIPVCYHCGSDFLMQDTIEEAYDAIAQIPKIKERKTFCVDCNQEVEYNLVQTRWEASWNGVSFWYNELEAFCPICGEEVYVGEINDINHETRERAYKEVVSARQD